MDAKLFVENINYLSNDEKEKKLKDPSLRQAFFDPSNHYPFVWLVQGLSQEDLLLFLDEDIISLLEKDSRLSDKLNAIITCDNPYNNTFLKNPRVISLIIQNISTLSTYLSSLNEDFGINYLNYLIDNHIDIGYLGYLSDKVQSKILQSEENYQKLSSVPLPDTILLDLGKNATEELLKKPRFQEILCNYDIRNISYIISKGVSLPLNLQTSSTIVNKYLEVENINVYYDYFNALSDCNTHLQSLLREKRKEKYKDKVESIDSNLQIFSEYQNVLNSDDLSEVKDISLRYELMNVSQSPKKKLRILQEYTITKLLEMTIDINYEDLTYNFLKNVKAIINFVKDSKEDIIPKDRLDIYRKLARYYSLTIDEKKSLFYELLERKTNIPDFYDDFKACYNTSLKMLKDSCFDPKKLPKKETIDGIDVYTLEGEKFKMLINHTYTSRDTKSESEDLWFNSDKTASLSLIGDAYLGTFRDPKYNVILGFTNFDINKIMHVHRGDSYSNTTGSKAVINIYTPDTLLSKTNAYNEILIKEDSDLKPSYVVCYDEIKVGDIDASKKLGNIPIVVINTKKYKWNKTNMDFNSPSYITSAEAYLIKNYRGGK